MLQLLKTSPGVEHEGTFVNYYCHWLDAWHRRIRSIAERAAENKRATRGAKSDQFKLIGAGKFFVDFFAEFDTCPERPINAFPDT